jgi:hypothetical protein
VSHLLSELIFRERCDRKRKQFQKGTPLLEPTLGHQLRPATVIEVDGLFSAEHLPSKNLSRKKLVLNKKIFADPKIYI